MREILFRGKRVDNDEWVYGSFCMDAIEQFKGPCGIDGFIRLYDKAKGKMQMHEVDRETVGQYTGLNDKHGKRIFEGDIVCVHDRVWSNNQWEPKKFICEIVFSEMDARFTGIGKQRPREWLYHWNAKSYEVIGNIHENLELLGGADVKDT